MSNQQVKLIKLSDLVLWSENPRDQIDSSADNQEIANLALSDKRAKWSLKKLAEQMGTSFDFSEIPTVVFHNEKPVVYDGNRRVILGLLNHELVTNSVTPPFKLPNFPFEIPCNVCEQKVALQNIIRKHAESGSWSPLQRDLFMHKFMNEPKSIFLVFDEVTGLISNNNELNKGFVRDEILTPENLSKLGLKREDDNLLSRSNATDTAAILDDLKTKIIDKTINTRDNRGKPFDVLDLENQKIIEQNKSNPFTPVSSNTSSVLSNSTKRKTRRTKGSQQEIFGGDLYLKAGDVNNLYRDINEIYHVFRKDPGNFSPNFMSIIRMSLRLIVELAASTSNASVLDKYVQSNFDAAKTSLDTDLKTFLHNQNVTKTSLIALLQNGAHSYSASSNKDQALAISIIVGAMLQLTHGK